MATHIRQYALLGGLTCSLLVIPHFASAQSLYKCVGENGRISYQQRPCAGSGSKMEVKTPRGSGDSVDADASTVSAKTAAVPPEPKPSSTAPDSSAKSVLPATPPPQARGRLDGWPKSGDRLNEGMSPRAVIVQWGRPHKVDIVEERGLFFDYCDFRVAFFFDGKLVSWVALFPESKAGAQLFNYGEPWTAAPIRWGFDRERKTFSNSVADRGDVQSWRKDRWIVTDAQGNIVSWCDADGSPMVPPTHRTAWE